MKHIKKQNKTTRVRGKKRRCAHCLTVRAVVPLYPRFLLVHTIQSASCHSYLLLRMILESQCTSIKVFEKNKITLTKKNSPRMVFCCFAESTFWYWHAKNRSLLRWPTTSSVVISQQQEPASLHSCRGLVESTTAWTVIQTKNNLI